MDNGTLYQVSSEDVAKILLQQDFQIALPNKQDKDQLNWIYEFFNGYKENNIQDVLTELQHIKTKIGSPPPGISPLGHVYSHLKVLSQMTESDPN